MIQRRSTRNLLCRLLVGVLLYAQLSVAAYACPGPMAMQGAPAVSHPAGSVPADAMAVCDAMTSRGAAGAANLCAEHCHQGEQSDQPAGFSVPAVVLASLYPMPLVPPAARLGQSAPNAARIVATAAPPHAILHCCFRI